MRIGFGYDAHRLADGRPLVIGGVTIPFARGLVGHSDADVLAHAACDALLGAAGLGDIGTHFPDNDDRYKDVYSIELLGQCRVLIRSAGLELVNLDATVHAQAPKIMPYAGQMRRMMANALQVGTDRINIKATTTEGLGFIGRGEGISASCTVLLDQLTT